MLANEMAPLFQESWVIRSRSLDGQSANRSCDQVLGGRGKCKVRPFFVNLTPSV
jgi:hypothetical protein